MGHASGQGRGSSIFRSAREEAEFRHHDAAQRDDKGGHMRCTSGRIVCNPSTGMPFTAVMTCEGGDTFEVSFATMREAEAFIRGNTPSPAARSTTYDHDVG